MNQLIISILENKYYLLKGAFIIVCCLISYKLGLNNGFIPHETLCKDDIINLDTCKDEMKEKDKLCMQEITKCKTECKIDTCKPICIQKVQDAIDNYKKLEKVLECND